MTKIRTFLNKLQPLLLWLVIEMVYG